MSRIIDAVHRDRVRGWIKRQREAHPFGTYEDALSDLQAWLDGCKCQDPAASRIMEKHIPECPQSLT